MQSVQDLALICREGDQHLGALATHAHQADRGLGVSICDGLENNVDSVGLGVVSCGLVVAVATAFAVVDNDHHRFKDHLDGSGGAPTCIAWGRMLCEIFRVSMFSDVVDESELLHRSRMAVLSGV